MEFKGYNGQVELTEKFLVIRREGALARMGHGRGEKMIRLQDVSGIQVKPATRMTNGFIQFTVPGEIAQTGSMKGSRTVGAAGDENSVLYTRKMQPEADAFIAAVRKAIA